MAAVQLRVEDTNPCQTQTFLPVTALVRQFSLQFTSCCIKTLAQLPLLPEIPAPPARGEGGRDTRAPPVQGATGKEKVTQIPVCPQGNRACTFPTPKGKGKAGRRAPGTDAVCPGRARIQLRAPRGCAAERQQQGEALSRSTAAHGSRAQENFRKRILFVVFLELRKGNFYLIQEEF